MYLAGHGMRYYTSGRHTARHEQRTNSTLFRLLRRTSANAICRHTTTMGAHQCERHRPLTASPKSSTLLQYLPWYLSHTLYTVTLHSIRSIIPPYKSVPSIHPSIPSHPIPSHQDRHNRKAELTRPQRSAVLRCQASTVREHGMAALQIRGKSPTQEIESS